MAVRPLAFVSLFVLVGSCASPSAPDLALDETLYRSPHYQAKVPPDRAAFVTPLVDDRKSPVMDASVAPHAVSWMPEGYWARSLVEMVDEIFRKEVTTSHVFARVSERADAQALVVKPSLVAGNAGVQEHAEGRRSFAEIGLRVIVFGPADASGKRTQLLDKTFADRRASDVTMRPPTTTTLTGLALRTTILQALSGLDQSNVARSGVPLDAGDKDTGDK